MKVLLSESGHIESYAVEGDLLGAVKCDPPDDLIHFEEHFSSYRMKEGKPVFDEARAQALAEQELLSGFRSQRETECFPIINRGKLWYDNLSEQQCYELELWYKAWLDVTQTQTIPVKPEWLK